MKIQQDDMFGTPKITKVKKVRKQSKASEYIFKYQSLGAGLQSSCITEMIVEGELPKVDVVIFADTGDEPDYVYQQVEYLRGRLEKVNIPLIVVSAGNMIEDLYSNGRFAAMPLFTEQEIILASGATKKQIGRLKRQCTANYKIEPIEKQIRIELLNRGYAKKDKKNAIRINKNIKVQCQLGISFDEVERMKPSKVNFIDNIYPLIDLKMTRKNCEEWLISHNLPVPKKSSCKRCPYHTKAYFREMKTECPGDWLSVIMFDYHLRDGTIRIGATAKGNVYFTKECIPLEQINLDTPQEKGQLDMCDEGYCFI